MLIRDQFGYLRDIPDQRFSGWSNPRFGEVLYDGLGNPLGLPFIAALAPLAAKILPIASSLLPMLAPSQPSAPAPASLPPPSPPAPLEPPPPPATPPPTVVMRETTPPVTPFPAPGPARPMVIFRRRRVRRRRRPPMRVGVERVTEQITVPPSFVAPSPMASESSGGVNGWYPAAPFGGYF